MNIFTNKTYRKVLLLFFVLIAFFATSISVKAGLSGSFAIPKAANAGDTFIVSVKYIGADIKKGEALIYYPDEMMTYISGGDKNNNAGVVQLSAQNNTLKDLTFNVKFKAKSEGTANFELETLGIYDTNNKALGKPSDLVSVKIGAAVSESKNADDATVPINEAASLTDGEIADLVQEKEKKSPLLFMIVALLLLIIILLILLILYRGKTKTARNEAAVLKEDFHIPIETESEDREETNLKEKEKTQEK
ncbi:MAG: hypothetical protein ACRCUS_09035 [Anaerovoracaceae bacterium]